MTTTEAAGTAVKMDMTDEVIGHGAPERIALRIITGMMIEVLLPPTLPKKPQTESKALEYS